MLLRLFLEKWIDASQSIEVSIATLEDSITCFISNNTSWVISDILTAVAGTLFSFCSFITSVILDMVFLKRLMEFCIMPIILWLCSLAKLSGDKDSTKTVNNPSILEIGALRSWEAA